MTADELLEAMLENVDDSYQKSVGYPLYDILSAFALSLADTGVQLEQAQESLDPGNLSGDDLVKYVYQRRGIVAKTATCATAALDITGTGEIERGDLFETDGGLQYEADSDISIVSSGTITVTCVTAGSVGNVGSGTITHMPVTIAGIVSCTNPDPATGGYDQESDADLLDRYYLSLREPAMSGNAAHYKQWALEVSGVGAVQVYPLAQGANTVEVMILDAAGLPADSALIAATQAYIDPDHAGTGAGAAPIGAHCYVSTPATLTVNVSVTVTALTDFDHDTIQASIEEQISVYLSEICLKQDYVSYGKMYAYIASADGVEDFSDLKLNGTAGNVSIPDKSVAVLGEVTITYA